MSKMQNLWNGALQIHEFLVPSRLNLGYTPYLWLVYNGFMFLPLIFGRPDPQVVFVTWASLVIFLPAYFAAYRACGRGLLPFVALFALLGAVVLPINHGGSVYFIYASAFAALAGPPSQAVRWIGLVVLLGVAEVWWFDLHISSAFVIPFVSFVVGAANMFQRKMDIKNEALRASREEIRRLASNAERERIARDLHDLLGHTLASISLKAELARRTVLNDPTGAEKELADIEKISRQATAQVRAAVAGFREGRIQSELATGRQLLESSGVWFEYELGSVDLSATQENTLALALREALTNVHRHADASSCWVTLREDGSGVRLTVRDDGRGGRVRPGSGIRGMRERLQALGGSLTVEANSPRGLIVQMVVPNPKPQELEAEALPEPAA
ncbi:MAG: sensor histidine kinase [Pseudomonadota bacterium]